jgi:hypothetical protein
LGKIANNELNINIDELRKGIAQIHQQVFGSIPQEAERAASDLLSALSHTKHQLKAITEKQEQESNLFQIRFTPLFNYIIAYFDELILGIQKHGQSIQVERIESLPAVAGETATRYMIRKVLFSNKKELIVGFVPAVVHNGVLVSYPSIVFEGPKDKTVDYSFWIRAHSAAVMIRLSTAPPQPIADLEYSLQTDPVSDERFREALSKNLSDLLKVIMALS